MIFSTIMAEEEETCTAVLFGLSVAVAQPCFVMDLPGGRLRVCQACAMGGNLVAGLAAPPQQQQQVVPLACFACEAAAVLPRRGHAAYAFGENLFAARLGDADGSSDVEDRQSSSATVLQRLRSLDAVVRQQAVVLRGGSGDGGSGSGQNLLQRVESSAR
jgi:hypothetical protein